MKQEKKRKSKSGPNLVFCLGGRTSKKISTRHIHITSEKLTCAKRLGEPASLSLLYLSSGSTPVSSMKLSSSSVLGPSLSSYPKMKNGKSLSKLKQAKYEYQKLIYINYAHTTYTGTTTWLKYDRAKSF